jgi:hypothetical protein
VGFVVLGTGRKSTVTRGNVSAPGIGIERSVPAILMALASASMKCTASTCPDFADIANDSTLISF